MRSCACLHDLRHLARLGVPSAAPHRASRLGVPSAPDRHHGGGVVCCSTSQPGCRPRVRPRQPQPPAARAHDAWESQAPDRIHGGGVVPARLASLGVGLELGVELRRERSQMRVGVKHTTDQIGFRQLRSPSKVNSWRQLGVGRGQRFARPTSAITRQPPHGSRPRSRRCAAAGQRMVAKLGKRKRSARSGRAPAPRSRST